MIGCNKLKTYKPTTLFHSAFFKCDFASSQILIPFICKCSFASSFVVVTLLLCVIFLSFHYILFYYLTDGVFIYNTELGLILFFFW